MDVDLSAWPGLELVASISVGHRNAVWEGRIDGSRVAVRRSRRTAASLDWEVDLIAFVAQQGVRAPTVVPTRAGQRHCDGIVVQSWLEGRAPKSSTDWTAVANALRELHRGTAEFPQRPGCCTVCELEKVRRSVDADLDQVPADVAARISSVFTEFEGVETSVIHGDPMADNIRIDSNGQVGFLDWDESRVDLVWHDLSNLAVQVLSDDDHAQAQRLSNAWEAVNAWTVEPDYAKTRLAALSASEK